MGWILYVFFFFWNFDFMYGEDFDSYKDILLIVGVRMGAPIYYPWAIPVLFLLEVPVDRFARRCCFSSPARVFRTGVLSFAV